MNRIAKLVWAGAMAQARWPIVAAEPTQVCVTSNPELTILMHNSRPTLPRGYTEPCLDTQGPSAQQTLEIERIPWYKIELGDGDWIGVGWEPQGRVLLIVEPKG